MFKDKYDSEDNNFHENIYFLDDTDEAYSIDEVETTAENKLPKILAITLEEMFTHSHGGRLQKEQYSLYIQELGDITHLIFQPAMFYDDSLDERAIECFNVFFQSIQSAVQKAAGEGAIDTDLYRIGFISDGADVLKTLRAIDSAIKHEPQGEDDDPESAPDHHSIMRAPLYTYDFDDIESHLKKRGHSENADRTKTPGLYCNQFQAVAPPSDIERSFETFQAIVAPYVESKSLSLSMTKTEEWYVFKIDTNDDADDPDYKESVSLLFDLFLKIRNPEHIKLDCENHAVVFESSTSIDLFLADVIKSIEENQIKYIPQAPLPDVNFWPMKYPEKPYEYVHAMLQSLTQRHLLVSGNLVWGYKEDIQSGCMEFSAHYMSEYPYLYEQDMLKMAAFFEDLTCNSGSWQGVTFSGEGASIHVSDVLDFCSMIEQYADLTGIELGNQMLNRKSIFFDSEDIINDANEFLEQDPTLLFAVRGLSFSNQEEFSQAVVKAADAIERNILICPFDTNDIRRSVAAPLREKITKEIIVASFMLNSPVMGLA